MYYFFFAPLGTELRVRRFPFAVVSLVAINFLYFLLFHYSPVHAARAGALAFDSANPTLLTAFTACFLHADWFHLLGNLAYLLTFGPALEDRLSGPRFLLLYLACGVGSMLTQYGSDPASAPGETGTLIMGASGAISGILGIFAVRCGFARVRVAHVTMALLQGRSHGGMSRINSMMAVAFWLFLQFVYALISKPGAGGVAYGTHVSGVLIGVSLALLMGLYRQGAVERLWIRSRRQADRGEWFAALGETLAYLKESPDDTDAWLQLGRLNRILRRGSESIGAFLKAIDILWNERRRHEAVRAARELRRHYPQARLRPALLYRLGLHLERHGDLGWAAHTFHDYALLYPNHQKAPSALLRAAEVEARMRNDLDRAEEIYQELIERYPSTPEAQRAARDVAAVTKIRDHRSTYVIDEEEDETGDEGRAAS
jgi:membrane associated rhomboid family serine protease